MDLFGNSWTLAVFPADRPWPHSRGNPVVPQAEQDGFMTFQFVGKDGLTHDRKVIDLFDGTPTKKP